MSGGGGDFPERFDDEELDAMMMELEEVEAVVEDAPAADEDYDGFGELSEEVEDEETPAFLAFMAPLMQLIERLCSASEPTIHYTFVCVHDGGRRVRGDSRLMYVMNTLGDAQLSDAYLAHQLFLIGSQCQIQRGEWEGYVRRLDPQVAFEHGHAAILNHDNLQQRVLLLDVLTAFLQELEGAVVFNYPPQVLAYATEHDIELMREGNVQTCPFLFFYEANVKSNDVTSAIKGSAGWGHHADFPALRLIRLILKHGGPTPMALEALTEEIDDEQAAAEDPMVGLLSLVRAE